MKGLLLHLCYGVVATEKVVMARGGGGGEGVGEQRRWVKA